MNEDTELLRRFAEDGSQEAFGELVRRKIDLVYAAALRQTGGDAHLAQDVTQGVFLALACRAAALQRHAVLTGWLYQTTRFVAAKAVRTQARWQRREQEANTMSILSDGAQPAWTKLRPVIDEAMHELDEKDRAALLLRFFEGRPLAEVGAAIGLPENSARMRVERALAKLSVRLARRGITSTAAALGVVLANQPVVAVPAAFAATVAGAAAAGAVVTGGGVAVALVALNFMNTTKLAVGAVCAVVVAGVGAYLGMHYQASRAAAPVAVRAKAPETGLVALREENRRLTDELTRRRGEQMAQAAERGSGVSASGGVAPLSRSAQWRVLVDLQRQKLVTPQVSFVNAEGKLEEAFVNLFELTSGERESLQQAVTKAGEQLATLERENATVGRDAGGGLVIAVKPFAETGGVVYDEVMKAFAQTLGAERNAAFLTLGAEKVEKALGRFGAEQRTVTITRVAESDGAGGKTEAVLVRDERRTPNGTNNSSSAYKTFAEAAGKMGTLAKLVPPDF